MDGLPRWEDETVEKNVKQDDYQTLPVQDISMANNPDEKEERYKSFVEKVRSST